VFGRSKVFAGIARKVRQPQGRSLGTIKIAKSLGIGVGTAQRIVGAL
jgi:hypothetical protein